MEHLVEKVFGDINWKYLPDVQLNLGTPIKDFQEHLLLLVKPEWKTRQLASKTFDAGITNALYAIFDAEKGLKESREDVVLLRVNGNNTDKLISRTDELITLVTLYRNGLSPPVYAQLSNGLCYGFVPGVNLSVNNFSDSKFMRLNARVMAKLHSVEIPTPFQGRGPLVWQISEKFMKLAPQKFDDPTKQQRFQDGIGSLGSLKKEIDEMESLLSKCDSPIVLCHNDLLCANFIYNEDKGEMNVIDFEYAGPNYLAYDIGNHFCEFAGVDNVDYNLYPNEGIQKEWIRYYLEESATLKGDAPSSSVTEAAVHSLYCQANKFALCAHLFWAVWGLVQAAISAIDFDYLEYAVLRFGEYKRRKQEFLSLK